MPEFVVLEGLKEGNRFYSPYTEGDDPTRLYDGTIAYKLLGFANTDEEARAIIRRGNPKSEIEIMSDYLFKIGRGLFTKKSCDDLSQILSKSTTHG